MHVCEKCEAIYFRRNDADLCTATALELPLITVGKKLELELEGGSMEIVCSSILKRGHLIYYTFEFLDVETGQWSRVFQLKGNEHLLREYGSQIQSKLVLEQH